MIYFLICVVIIIGILGAKFIPEQYDNKYCSELFWERMPKVGTVYQDNNAYYEISAVRTFGASWCEISFAVYLKYQKSSVKFYTATYVIPFDLVENANDVEDFKRVKAERIKDSQERFDLLYKKLIT